MPDSQHQSVLDRLADLTDGELKEAFEEVRRHRTRRKVSSIFDVGDSPGDEGDEGDEGGDKKGFFG
jgi:hypothetical protein